MIGFKALELRLNNMWVRDRVLDIIDLPHDYFVVKFSALLDYDFFLTREPWLLFDHYLIIEPWSVDFNLEEDEIERLAIWIRLPRLPFHLYDHKFLTFLGNKVGKAPKVDSTTMDQSRGRFAQVCVKVYLKKPLLSKYSMKGKVFLLNMKAFI